MEGVLVGGPYDGGEWEHRVVGVDVGCVFGRLLNRFHFFFAACVVEGADYDGLA
jgi:hypothetical protein